MGDLKIEEIINILKRNFRLILISTLSVTLAASIVTFFLFHLNMKQIVRFILVKRILKMYLLLIVAMRL